MSKIGLGVLNSLVRISLDMYIVSILYTVIYKLVVLVSEPLTRTMAKFASNILESKYMQENYFAKLQKFKKNILYYERLSILGSNLIIQLKKIHIF